MDLDHMPVPDRGDGFSLRQKAENLPRVESPAVIPECFQGHHAVDRRLPGKMNDTHATPADLADAMVAVRGDYRNGG